MNLDLENFKKIHSPGYVIAVYKNGKYFEYINGYREVLPNLSKCDKNTLYDIASLTKTYTATLIYIAYEEGKIDLNKKVKEIDNRFVNLANVKIIDLLCHNQDIWTNGYFGDAKSKNDFYKILFSAKIKSRVPTYVDVHYIILSTILEKIYQKSYTEILKEKILNKLNLKMTTCYPEDKNIASNNYEHLNNEIIDYLKLGLVHDKKARVAKEFGIILGNASIFTTASDLLLFLKSFLDCSLLNFETIQIMLRKGVNTEYPSLNHYNNMGARYKNKLDMQNEVPAICSENTIVFSGYTGPMYLIDFDKNIIIVIMCNVLHNTKINRQERKKLTEEIMQKIAHMVY